MKRIFAKNTSQCCPFSESVFYKTLSGLGPFRASVLGPKNCFKWKIHLKKNIYKKYEPLLSTWRPTGGRGGTMSTCMLGKSCLCGARPIMMQHHHAPGCDCATFHLVYWRYCRTTLAAAVSSSLESSLLTPAPTETGAAPTRLATAPVDLMLGNAISHRWAISRMSSRTQPEQTLPNACLLLWWT